MGSVDDQIEPRPLQHPDDVLHRNTPRQDRNVFRLRQQRFAVLRGTHTVACTGCPTRNSTSSRPSVVPANTQILHIAVSSGCDQLTGHRFDGGAADQHGAEHIHLRLPQLCQRQDAAALPLTANIAHDAAQPFSRQTAQQDIASSLQVVGVYRAGGVVQGDG